MTSDEKTAERVRHLPTLSLLEHGAQRHEGAVLKTLEKLHTILGAVPNDRAGARLCGFPGLKALLDVDGSIGALAASHLGETALPVRALFFDKTAASNWSLPWHQDRTIAVAERRDTAGFGPWTIKGEMHHVEPPASLQAEMLTVRVHLDPVDEANAPLLIALGSHRLGRIPQTEILNVVKRCGSESCLANAGDVWAYSTPILHASEAAANARHRRVLQVDYATGKLPGSLRWLGV